MASDVPSAGLDALWHILRYFKGEVFAESAGTLLHIGAEELDGDLYARSGFSHVLCTHHNPATVERLRGIKSSERTRVDAVRLDPASPSADTTLLGLTAQRDVSCVMWRLDKAASVAALARSLRAGLAFDAVVYVIVTDGSLARQAVLEGWVSANEHTLFLPDGSRRPVARFDAEEVARAFGEEGYRCIYTESLSDLADRAGRNMLPVDHRCCSIHKCLAFTPTFRP